MKVIGFRELRQRASAVLRRFERGRTIGVTDRGRLVAVEPAHREVSTLADPRLGARGIAEVLDELREER